MKKAICYISPRSVHSYRWIEAFHKKRYNLSFISDFQTWLAPIPHGVPAYVLPALNIHNVQRRLVPNALAITRVLRKLAPDIVHVHTQHHYVPFVTLNRIPFILTSWGLEVLMLPHMNFARRALASYAAIEACKITVDAECLKQIWVNMGVPDRKIEVIPFGVETDLFNTQVNGQSIRKILGIAKDDIAIISTRSFFPHYNIECLVKAAKEIVKKHSNVKFIIKGEGPLKGHIKGLVEKLDIKQYMRFIDVLPYQEIPQYLAAADIYVSTSFVDSTSVSLLEAMACGLPPITTDIAGNREWIKNGMNGLLYPPKDHVALAERISQLVEHLDLRKQFGERSNQIIMERASWENCVSRMEALYQSLT